VKKCPGHAAVSWALNRKVQGGGLW